MKKNFYYINTESSLGVFLSHADSNTQNSLSLDIEFERIDSYFPKPALIQITYGSDIFLIDPLSLSLQPHLQRVFSNHKGPIILFSAQQDVEVLKTSFACTLPRLFDCQLALTFLNEGHQLGYQDACQKILGISIPKDQQHTNWLKRPLEEDQCTYAAQDVEHLENLYTHLKQRLKENPYQYLWFKEDCLQRTFHKVLEPVDAFKRFQHYPLDEKSWYAIYELSRVREIFAQTHNLIRRKVCSDETLIHIAKVRPKDTSTIRSCHPDFLPLLKDCLDDIHTSLTHAPDFVKTCVKNQIKNFIKRKSKKVPSSQLTFLIKLADQFCKTHNIPNFLLANRESLTAFVANSHDPSHPLLQGWRFEAFGRDAQSALSSMKIKDPTPDAETSHLN